MHSNVSGLENTSAGLKSSMGPSQSSTSPSRASRFRRLSAKHDTRQSSVHAETQMHMERIRLPDGLKIEPHLAQKVLQIGSAEVVSQLQEYAQHLRNESCHNNSKPSPNNYGFLTIDHIKDGSGFLKSLSGLTRVIECNILGELFHQLRKRIAFAHFYHAYTLAQENPRTFLSWSPSQTNQRSLPPRGGYKTAVLHRFVQHVFTTYDQQELSKVRFKARGMKDQISKVQTWRSRGKNWAKLILRFGYGILLLLPDCLTDEE